MQTTTRTVTGETKVRLTISPHDEHAEVVVEADRFDDVHDALFSRRGLAYRIGLARLGAQGDWLVEVDGTGYLMEVVA